MLRSTLIFLILAVRAVSAQEVEYVRPLNSVAHLLSIRQEQNLERTLGELFPTRTLHKATIEDRWDLIIAERSSRLAASEKGKIVLKRITYDVLKQHGKKYAVVIFSGSWKAEASELAIFRIEAGGYPTPVYHSRCWQSNFSDSYHEILSVGFGKENMILLKEGENGKSPFVIASLFSFREKKGDEKEKGYFALTDQTPRLPRLSARVDFPLKPLYGQYIKLEKISDDIRLQAADVEFSWDHNHQSGMQFWKYNRAMHKFTAEKDSDVHASKQR